MGSTARLPWRVAICGGSPSGLRAAERLLEHGDSRASVSLFLQLWDPDQAAHIWGRAPRICVDYVPQRVGWVPEATRQRFAQGSFEQLSDTEFGLAPDAMTFCRRWLLDMARKHPQRLRVFASRASFSARDAAEADARELVRTDKVPVSMRFQGASQTWRLEFWDLAKDKADAALAEEFDFVAMSYDFSFRLTHVKALRELFDSGMPAAEAVVKNFASGLHCAKTIVCAVRVTTKAQGAEAPWLLHGAGGNLLFAERYPSDPSVFGWQKSGPGGSEAGSQFWLLHSTCEFARWSFLSGSGLSRTRRKQWDKAGTGRELCEEFRGLLVRGGDQTAQVQQLGNTYHWDLPLPLTYPKFAADEPPLLLDGEKRIAWIGDFAGVAERLRSGAALFGLDAALAAGERGGDALVAAMSSCPAPEKAKLPLSSLPDWGYHEGGAAAGEASAGGAPRGGGQLCLLSSTSTKEHAAYRGTCNWKVAETIAASGDFKASCAHQGLLWLEHLPYERALELRPPEPPAKSAEKQAPAPEPDSRRPTSASGEQRPKRRWMSKKSAA